MLILKRTSGIVPATVQSRVGVVQFGPDGTAEVTPDVADFFTKIPGYEVVGGVTLDPPEEVKITLDPPEEVKITLDPPEDVAQPTDSVEDTFLAMRWQDQTTWLQDNADALSTEFIQTAVAEKQVTASIARRLLDVLKGRDVDGAE